MEPPSSHSIAILNESGRRAPRQIIARAIATTLDLHGRRGACVEVLLCTEEAIRDFNRRYRKLDEATDVLTFPGGGLEGAPLGDIAIAVPYAERQAAARGVTLAQELGFLAIHGALHLLGFDDETEQDRAEMVREMNRSAVAAGLKPDRDWASLLHAKNSDEPRRAS